MDSVTHPDTPVGHDPLELVPVHLPQSAPLSPPAVARHSVLPAPRHVDGGQVHPELLARLLEQVVGHLLGHGVVQPLGHLVDQPHHEGVGPPDLVKVVRLLQHLREPLAADVPVGLAPSLHGGGQQGVAKPEDLADEATGDRGIGLGIVSTEVSILNSEGSV